MQVIVDWTEDTPETFIASVEHHEVDYTICVERNAANRWIYTINSEALDMPFCSTGSFTHRELAQRASFRRVRRG